MNLRRFTLLHKGTRKEGLTFTQLFQETDFNDEEVNLILDLRHGETVQFDDRAPQEDGPYAIAVYRVDEPENVIPLAVKRDVIAMAIEELDAYFTEAEENEPVESLHSTNIKIRFMDFMTWIHAKEDAL